MIPNVAAPGKLILLVVIVVCATVLLVTNDLDTTAWVAIVGPIAGYAVGNGVGAARGQDQAPMFTPKPDDVPKP